MPDEIDPTSGETLPEPSARAQQQPPGAWPQPSAAVWPPPPASTYEPLRTDGSYGDVRDFQIMNSWLTVLLFFVTLGVYQPFWMMRIGKVMNRLVPEKKIDFGWLWALFGVDMVYYIITFVDGYTSSTNPVVVHQFNTTETYISYVVCIFSVIYSFKFRNRLNIILNRTSPELGRFSGVGTFFLGIIYLQFRLASRIKERNKQVASMYPTGADRPLGT